MVSLVPSGAGDSNVHPYASAVVFAFFSLFVALLIIPPLIQHFRNRNIGATVLVAGMIISNFFNFLNAVIWSNDDMEHWYNGIGLCDVEAKIFLSIQTLLPAAMACILRALANVMDTDNTTWMRTTAQRRRAYAIDLVCCVGFPCLQMITHYIVQPTRFHIWGIAGCAPSSDGTWLAFLLLLVPPLIWVVADVAYASIILYRLLKYRLTFNALLAKSNTNKSRFLRLYCLCCVCILGLIPVEAYILVKNNIGSLPAYSWNETHHPTDWDWNSAMLVPSYGNILYDRIMWLAGGIAVFLFFGFGKDATKMYREGLRAIGLGRIFPSLKQPDSPTNSQHRASITGTINSFSSKAKLFFKRKDTTGTFDSSIVSTTDSMSPSPKKMTFLESIRENQKEDRRLRDIAQPMQQKPKPGRLASIFGKKMQSSGYGDDPFILTNVTGNNRFLSTVSAEPVSPTSRSHIRGQSNGDVLVKKEVRQASETAETLPSKMYEGV